MFSKYNEIKSYLNVEFTTFNGLEDFTFYYQQNPIYNIDLSEFIIEAELGDGIINFGTKTKFKFHCIPYIPSSFIKYPVGLCTVDNVGNYKISILPQDDSKQLPNKVLIKAIFPILS